MLLFSSGGYIFRDNHDDLFDDEGPPNKYKEYSDDFRDEEYTEVERTHTTRTEKITRGTTNVIHKVSLTTHNLIRKNMLF